MEINDAIFNKEINNALKTLEDGGVLLYPSDTIWGIGCDATNAKAVDKIYNIKKRDKAKSLIVLIDSVDKLPFYIKDIPDITYDLIDNIDRPLTIIYPNAYNIAPNVLAGDGSLGIRIVKNGFCKELIRVFGKPIVSTSANFSGEPTAISFNHISEKLKAKMDYTVSILHTQINLIPSQIIKLTNDNSFKVIRS
jgi:L-threonylcarbamoyladenylate synthase